MCPCRKIDEIRSNSAMIAGSETAGNFPVIGIGQKERGELSRDGEEDFGGNSVIEKE